MCPSQNDTVPNRTNNTTPAATSLGLRERFWLSCKGLESCCSFSSSSSILASLDSSISLSKSDSIVRSFPSIFLSICSLLPQLFRSSSIFCSIVSNAAWEGLGSTGVLSMLYFLRQSGNVGGAGGSASGSLNRESLGYPEENSLRLIGCSETLLTGSCLNIVSEESSSFSSSSVCCGL